MPFYKGPDGKALRLFRGECAHPNHETPKSYLRALYFGNVDVANVYAGGDSNTGDYYTSRVFPVYLILDRPFIDQPLDPFLEMRYVRLTLGLGEAKRIAIRFAKYIEETDNWCERVNPDNKYKGVADYLHQGGSVDELYFQAHRFFDSLMEINRLRKRGYDGAIHRGSGIGSADTTEYCVFSRNQVYFTTSQTFLGKE